MKMLEIVSDPWASVRCVGAGDKVRMTWLPRYDMTLVSFYIDYAGFPSWTAMDDDFGVWEIFPEDIKEVVHYA